VTFKELREQSGMTRTQFAKYFNISYRTIQNWELGLRECPQYLLDLMEYKLKKVYLIYKDSIDDACEIKGYIIGTEEDADRYCDELNKNSKYTWEEYTWERLDLLNPKADMERGGEDG
jgi:transcriptional regulator with XRE-family HTH domain